MNYLSFVRHERKLLPEVVTIANSERRTEEKVGPGFLPLVNPLC